MSRRPNLEARRKILRVAYELFASEGYEAVSMERVAGACRMKKATLFYYYPSKQALGRAVIEAASKRSAEGVRAIFSDAEADPVAVVRALFDRAFGEERDCSRGCFIGRMGQELDARHEALSRCVSSCMREWREDVAAYLDGWRRRGYFRRGFDAAEVADGLLALYEGGVLIGRVARQRRPLEHAREVAVTVVVSWKG